MALARTPVSLGLLCLHFSHSFSVLWPSHFWIHFLTLLLILWFVLINVLTWYIHFVLFDCALTCDIAMKTNLNIAHNSCWNQFQALSKNRRLCKESQNKRIQSFGVLLKGVAHASSSSFFWWLTCQHIDLSDRCYLQSISVSLFCFCLKLILFIIFCSPVSYMVMWDCSLHIEYFYLHWFSIVYNCLQVNLRPCTDVGTLKVDPLSLFAILR